MIIRAIDVAGSELEPPPAQLRGPAPAWVRVRPGLRRGAAIATDTLTALGKNIALSGQGRNEQEDIYLASAWMRARQIRDLVLWDAQELTIRTLPTATRVAELADANLWLLYQEPTQESLLRRLRPYESDISDLDLLTRKAPSTTRKSQRAWDLGSPTLSPFYAFRDEAAARNPLQLVPFDQRIQRAENAFNKSSHPEVVLRQQLSEILHAGHPHARLVAELKGLQAAAWHRDYYIHIDFVRLLNSQELPQYPLTEVDEQLLSYRQPLRAIAISLSLRGHDLTQIQGLRLSDANPDHAYPQLSPNHEITDDLATCIHAQFHLRHAQTATLNDPLLPLSARSLATYIRQAATDLGIHAHGRRVLTTRKLQHWLSSLGITIHPIS